MQEYYTWAKSYKSKAQAMLDTINNHDQLPMVGTCNGKPAPEKQQTTSWCSKLTEWVDGRFGFPRIPAATLDKMGVSQEARDAMLEAYAPRIDQADALPLTVSQQYALDHPDEI